MAAVPAGGNPSMAATTRPESECLADHEDGAGLAVEGVGAARDVDVGVGVGEGEVDAVDGGGDADLPVPVVVAGDSVVGEALDILVADGAEQLEGDVLVGDRQEGERDGELSPLVPGDAGAGEEVGAVSD